MQTDFGFYGDFLSPARRCGHLRGERATTLVFWLRTNMHDLLIRELHLGFNSATVLSMPKASSHYHDQVMKIAQKKQ